MLVKTGGGDACGASVLSEIFHKYIQHYFKRDALPYTFDRFIGQDITNYSRNKPLETLIFAKPGEETYNKFLSLRPRDMANSRMSYVVGVSQILQTDDRGGGVRART